MLKMLNEYVNQVRPTEQFLGLTCINNKLKVVYATHVDIATIENGKFTISVEEGRNSYEMQTRIIC